MNDIKTIAELITFKKLITEVYPAGIVSIVSDSFDFWSVVTKIVPALKSDILNRKPDSFGNAKVVLRPDSSDPVKIITGYDVIGKFDSVDDFYARGEENLRLQKLDEYSAVMIGDRYYCVSWYDPSRFTFGPELSKAEVDGAIQCLWDIFGGTINKKMFKTLDSHIGLIYGDSITQERTDKILSRLAYKGFAADNVVYGTGSVSFQLCTRDTMGFAMKCTYIEGNGKEIEVFKDPKTDSGKKSAKGLVNVTKDSDGNFVLNHSVTKEQEQIGELRTVFLNGDIKHIESYETIRNRLKATM